MHHRCCQSGSCEPSHAFLVWLQLLDVRHGQSTGSAPDSSERAASTIVPAPLVVPTAMTLSASNSVAAFVNVPSPADNNQGLEGSSITPNPVTTISTPVAGQALKPASQGLEAAARLVLYEQILSAAARAGDGSNEELQAAQEVLRGCKVRSSIRRSIVSCSVMSETNCCAKLVGQMTSWCIYRL